MTIDIRQLLGLVLVAVGLVTATAGLTTIVDVTLLDGTPEATDVPTTPDEPNVLAAPPAPTRTPTAPADEPTEPAEAPVDPTPEVDTTPGPEREEASPESAVTTPPSEPVAPTPASDEAVQPVVTPVSGTAAPSPRDETPTTPEFVAASCVPDWKPEDWPWVERAGNQGEGVGWGPPIGHCHPNQRRATPTGPPA